MASIQEPRFETPVRRPARQHADGATSRANGHEIRVPRLLVLASEISWRALVCAAAGVVVVFAVVKVGFVVIPVAVALLLATLFVPPARALERRGVPRALATALVFIAGVLTILALLTLVIAPIAADADKLGDQIRVGADKLGSQVADLPLGMSEAEIQKQIDTVDDRLRDNNTAIRSGVVSGAQAAGQFLAAAIITLVVAFFFVKDGPVMWRWIVSRFPESRRPAFEEFGSRSWRALSAYVKGVVAVATIDAVGIGIALWAIGVPLVLPLAALTFILAFIPIIGAIVAGAAAALVAFAFEGVGAALLVVLAVLVVQQLEGNVLYPVIVGRTLQLHPVVVLLAVTVGGVLYGIPGAALAVPVAVVVTAAVTTVEHHAEHGEVAVGPPPVQDSP